MPYIKSEERITYNELIDAIVKELQDNGAQSGHENFVISSIVWKLFEKHKNYENANKLMGVLSCVGAEFYRKQVVPYEMEKEKLNGDII